MKKLIYIFSFVMLILVSACSSSEEAAKEDEEKSEPEIYIFDDVAPAENDTSEVVESEPETEVIKPVETSTKYYVQIGAFTTIERAHAFVSEHANQVSYPLEISYSEDVKLHVVQLPPFSTRDEAEKVRNHYWHTGLFKDAFILKK